MLRLLQKGGSEDNSLWLMAFATSTDMFQNAFVEPNTDMDKIDEFLKLVVDYLDTRSDYAEAETLKEWIQKGNPISGFICRYDLSDDMSYQMLTNGIPFVAITDKLGDLAYLVRECDEEQINTLREQVLEEKAHYFKETNLNDLKKDLLTSKEKDKSVIFLSGLSEEEMEIMKSLLDENLDGDEVGIDEMEDGTFMFSFKAKKAMKKGYRDAVNLCMLSALMMMQSKGFKKDMYLENARNKSKLMKALSNSFRVGSKNKAMDTWIVGKGTRYVKAGESGFEYGVAVNDENGFSLEELYSADISVPDYQEQLNSYVLSIPEATYTLDAKQAMLHLSKADDTRTIAENYENKVISSFEKEVVQKAVEIAAYKTASDRTMNTDGHWDEKFEIMMKEIATVIESAQVAINSRDEARAAGVEFKVPDDIDPPKGYSKTDIQQIMDISEKSGLSLNSYINAIGAMRHIEVYMSKAEPDRMKNIDTLVESAKDKTGQREQRDRGGRGTKTPSKINR